MRWRHTLYWLPSREGASLFLAAIAKQCKSTASPLLKTRKTVVGCRAASTSSIPPVLKELPRRIVSSGQSLLSQLRTLQESLNASTSSQHVAKLHFESFAQRHGRLIVGIGMLVTGSLIWNLTSTVWLYVSPSSSNINTGSLGLTIFVLSVAYMSLRRWYGVNPDAVYRLALLKLNTHPGILEVMGAPLAGSASKSMILSGGGPKLEGWMPRIYSRRVKMLFPVYGTRREGFAFVDAKKYQGRYVMKVLGVDVRLPDDQEQRIYLQGDSSIYSKGGVLAALREPLLKSPLAEGLDAREDEQDKAEDAKERKLERERKRRERADRAPKDLDRGGGMYLYEKLYWNLRTLGTRITNWRQRQEAIHSAKSQ